MQLPAPSFLIHMENPSQFHEKKKKTHLEIMIFWKNCMILREISVGK